MSATFSKKSAIIAIMTAGIIGVVILAGLLSYKNDVQPTLVKTAHATPLDTAQAYYDQRDYKQAVPLLKTYLEKTEPADRKIPLVRDLLISSYWQTNDYQKAFELLGEVSEANPNDIDSVYRLGLLASEMGEPETAEGYFTRAIGAKPGQSPYHTAYAQTLSELGRHEEARGQWNTVMSLTPADSPYRATVHGQIGDTYLIQNLPESAAAEFRAGLAIEPDNEYLQTQLDTAGG